MYGYYAFACMGPRMQPYLWWKRYLTQLQIAQFVLLFAHGVYFCLYQRGYHWFFSADVILQTLLYIYLFTAFYRRTYRQAQVKEARRRSSLLLNANAKTE